MDSELAIERLERRHDRQSFDCGVAALNTYLAQHARRHAAVGTSATWVLVEGASPRILGYYTLAASAIAQAVLPEEIRRRIPLHPLPAVRLCRLAIDRREQGRGHGSLLFVDALRRVMRLAPEIGIAALEIDAIDDAARAYYLRFGCVPLQDDPRHLYMSIRTAERALRGL